MCSTYQVEKHKPKKAECPEQYSVQMLFLAQKLKDYIDFKDHNCFNRVSNSPIDSHVK